MSSPAADTRSSPRRAVRRASLTLLLACALPDSARADQRLSFEFDLQLAENPTLVGEKLDALLGKIPPGFSLPLAWVDTLPSAPDAVAPPTVTLWFFDEVRAQLLRATQVTETRMSWPGPEICEVSSQFTIPVDLQLLPDGGWECEDLDDTIRDVLTRYHDACLDLELPERYVLGHRVPDGLSQDELTAFVDDHTTTLEGQIGLAGAGFSEVLPQAGLLPDDFVTTLRRVLWKIRPAPLLHAREASDRLALALQQLEGRAGCFEPRVVDPLLQQLLFMLEELGRMIALVEAEVAAGQTRAAQQQQCVQAAGRTRPELPYTALTDEEREFIAFWLGGVYWRMRGAALIMLDSTQSYRRLYARRAFASIAQLASGTEVANSAADAIYCNLFDGWGDWMDMGTSRDPDAPAEERQDTYYDLVQMTDRGRQHVDDFPLGALACILYAPGIDQAPAAYLAEAGYDVSALRTAGLSMGPCYLYGLNPLKAFRYYAPEEATPPYSYFIEGFTAVGEFCTGASLGLGLTRALLAGTPSGAATTTLCGTRECGEDPCGNLCGACSGDTSCAPDGRCVAVVADGGAVDAHDSGRRDTWDEAGADEASLPSDRGAQEGSEGDGPAGEPDALTADAAHGPPRGDASLAAAQPGCQCGSLPGDVAPASLSLWLLGFTLTRWRRCQSAASQRG